MTDQGENLVWSPIEPHVIRRCGDEGGIRLIVSPFIQRDALCHLLDGLSSHAELKVITRWNARDLASGVSDPFVFEECRDRHVPLYLHPAIHLKLITMASGLCFCGSANITATGLGLDARGNVEAGLWVHLGLEDWRRVYQIVSDSRLADEAVFDAAVTYRDRFLHAAPPLPPLTLPPPPLVDLTLTSLPATMSPEEVAAFAAGDVSEPASGDRDLNRLVHDVVHFGVPGENDKDIQLRGIGERFLKRPFVREIIDYIRESGTLRFGEMTAWIHAHCRDVPVPYRWEVKEATNVLYNWLAFYVAEISWSVPGQRSQVIEWRERQDT